MPIWPKISIEGITQVVDSSLYADERSSSRTGITLIQSLMRGAGISANMASLRQARLDTLFTEYELRGFTEQFVANIEGAYWDYAVARARDSSRGDNSE